MSYFPFHLAIRVHDLNQARDFYARVLGCEEGRSDSTWIDFNLYGHQLVCHLDTETAAAESALRSRVDGDQVPVPHFGVVLDLENWRNLAQRIENCGIRFEIEPHTRFQGQPGEQSTMFLFDPSGNALEFKAFRSIKAQLFAKNH